MKFNYSGEYISLLSASKQYASVYYSIFCILKIVNQQNKKLKKIYFFMNERGEKLK